MALGERANIDYKIETDDSDIDDVNQAKLDDRVLEEVERAGGIAKIQKFVEQKNVKVKDIPAEITKEVEERIPTSLLAPSTNTETKTKSESLLDRK
jgi:hypothetical protein